MLKELGVTHKWRLLGMYGLMLVAEGIQASMPMLLGGAIDAAITSGKNIAAAGWAGLAWVPIALWFGADVIQTLLNTTRYMLDTRIFGRIGVDLKTRVAAEQFQAARTESQVQTRVGLTDKLTHFYQYTAQFVVGCTISFVCGLYALYHLNFSVFVATSLFLIPVGIRGLLLARRLVPENSKYYDEAERNMDVIKSRSLPGINKHYNKLLTISVRISNIHATSFAVMSVLEVSLVAVILYLLAASPGVTAGSVYAIYAYVLKVTGNVNALPNLITEIVDTLAVTKRLRAPVEIDEPEVDEPEVKEPENGEC